MDILLFALNGLVMLVAPLVVGTILARRYRAEWGFFGAGAATFVASQVLHIPFNNFMAGNYLPEVGAGFSGTLVIVAAFYGLSAGMFEEVARFVTFRFWRKDARTWSQGLMVGAGHGGIESLLLGLLFVINMVVLAGISRGYFTSLVPQGALPETLAHLDALIALPWYDKLLGGVERVLAIILHLSLSLMVLRAARKGSIVWLVLAILWHATFNAVALIVAALTNAVTVEAVLALLAAGSLLLILRWRDEPQEILEEETAHASPPATRPRRPLEASDVSDRLDETRYF